MPPSSDNIGVVALAYAVQARIICPHCLGVHIFLKQQHTMFLSEDIQERIISFSPETNSCPVGKWVIIVVVLRIWGCIRARGRWITIIHTTQIFQHSIKLLAKTVFRADIRRARDTVPRTLDMKSSRRYIFARGRAPICLDESCNGTHSWRRRRLFLSPALRFKQPAAVLAEFDRRRRV